MHHNFIITEIYYYMWEFHHIKACCIAGVDVCSDNFNRYFNNYLISSPPSAHIFSYWLVRTCHWECIFILWLSQTELINFAVSNSYLLSKFINICFLHRICNSHWRYTSYILQEKEHLPVDGVVDKFTTELYKIL